MKNIPDNSLGENATLEEHFSAFMKMHNIPIAKEGTTKYNKQYKQYAEWAFSDLTAIKSEEEMLKEISKYFPEYKQISRDKDKRKKVRRRKK